MKKRPAVLVLGVLILATIGLVLTAVGSTPHPDHGESGSHPPRPSGASGVRVAFYGDSYTLGTGASSDEKRWSTIICRERGWTEYNPSVNGLGFVNNRDVFGEGDEPSEVIANHPDILFITMGLNDNFRYDTAASRIHSQIGDDFTRLRKALPDARIIVVEPFWYTDERPSSLTVISGWVKAAAGRIHADYIPGASSWIEHHPEWMAADGLHPNDRGYAEIAKRMDEALTELRL